MAAATSGFYLGFHTVVHETVGYVGGYLVTNAWGRPLEFRLTSAVQPTRVQQILYGHTLEPYVFADLIAKTLLDKTSTAVQVVITDKIAVLDLRQHIEVPLVVLDGPGRYQWHPDFSEDGRKIRDLFARLDGMDLFEPFLRIREAIAEARKLGVTIRAA